MLPNSEEFNCDAALMVKMKKNSYSAINKQKKSSRHGAVVNESD